MASTLAELKAHGMGLVASCGGPKCGHAWPLDLDVLIEIYGTDYTYNNERRIAFKLRCTRCKHLGGSLMVVADIRPRF
jgi:hypothetical protein